MPVLSTTCLEAHVQEQMLTRVEWEVVVDVYDGVGDGNDVVANATDFVWWPSFSAMAHTHLRGVGCSAARQPANEQCPHRAGQP